MQRTRRASYCLSAAVVLFACGTGDAGARGEAQAPRDAACADLENPIDRIVCYADRATESGELADCDAAAEEVVRYQCYAIFAERRETPDPCRKIPGTDEHQDVRDLCLSDVAPLVEDAELCREIEEPGFRDSCLLEVFRATSDAALCAEIEDPGLKSLCTGEPVVVDP